MSNPTGKATAIGRVEDAVNTHSQPNDLKIVDPPGGYGVH